MAQAGGTLIDRAGCGVGWGSAPPGPGSFSVSAGSFCAGVDSFWAPTPRLSAGCSGGCCAWAGGARSTLLRAVLGRLPGALKAWTPAQGQDSAALSKLQ